MKNRILMIGLGFLWACSGDPNQQGNQDRSPGASEVHDAADSTRENENGDGNVTATQGESAASESESRSGSISKSSEVIFNGGNDGINASKTKGANDGEGQVKGSAADHMGQTEAVDGSKASGGTGPVPSPGIAEGDEGSVTPPHVVTGAYLVGALLPSEAGEPIKVGLIVKFDDRRLSLETGFQTNWFMTAVTGDASQVKLQKSKDKSYDRVLEFDGTMEEFAAIGDAIALQVSVVEVDPSLGLNAILVKTLGELLVN